MKCTIIVTDLTRFSTKEKVCLAGIDPETGILIRPMPYMNQADCVKNMILPGSKLHAEFCQKQDAAPPHVEDCWYRNMTKIGEATSEEFYNLLERTAANSICAGFGVEVTDKVITPVNTPSRSIITIRAQVKLHPGYNGDLQKIRATITDNAGLTLEYLSITDLGFYRLAQEMQSRNELNKLDAFISSREVFVRIGLGRQYTSPDGRNGFWLQVNGIYTFPDFFVKIRSYE